MDFGKKPSNEELKQLVNESFLPAAEKRALLDLYAREGASPVFLQRFETEMVMSLRQKTAIAKGLDREVETEFARIKDEYDSQRANLTEKLESDLAGLPPGDVTAKAQRWDAYYLAVDDLQKKVTDLIQKISAKVLVNMAK